MRRLWLNLAVVALAATSVEGLADSALSAGPKSITQSGAVVGGISSGDGPGFPILITDPGSYRLDSDLYPAGAPYGIFVQSPNVTIDFNGFRLYGGALGPTGAASPDGIRVGQPGITIKNGTITRFQRHAIFTFADALTVENMRITLNGAEAGSDAITCGRLCVVRDSNINQNFGKAFRGGEGSLVENSMIAQNCEGLEMLAGGMVLRNLITRNRCDAVDDNRAIRGNADSANVGYGDNFITSHDNPQTIGAVPLAPNACSSAC
jgi:hypothetical protein